MIREISAIAIGVLFILAGANHFRAPGFYEQIVPPQFGNAKLLVQVSGIAEILGGVGALIPATRSYAAWWLIALLVAVFPANIYMAMRADLFPRIQPWMLYARLPLQAVLVAWVWWACL